MHYRIEQQHDGRWVKAFRAALNEEHWKVLEHSAYSPEIRTCHFEMFPNNFKESLRGIQFPDQVSVLQAVGRTVALINKKHFDNGILRSPTFGKM